MPKRVLKRTDKDWAVLYYTVICKHVSTFPSLPNIEKTINEIRRAYHRITATSNTDVNYGKAIARYAYTYLYGSCHSAMVETMVGHYIDIQKEAFTDFVISKGRLHVCSLGGGPGCDLLGLTEAIHKKVYDAAVHLTIIDKYAKWYTLFQQLSQTIRCCEETNFLTADLLNPYDRENCKESITNADIICMVKFVSVIMHQNREECLKLIEFVLEEASPGTIFLFIDNAGGGFANAVHSVIDHTFFKLVHLRESITFKMKGDPTSWLQFFGNCALTKCKITISIWQKRCHF